MGNKYLAFIFFMTLLFGISMSVKSFLYLGLVQDKVGAFSNYETRIYDVRYLEESLSEELKPILSKSMDAQIIDRHMLLEQMAHLKYNFALTALAFLLLFLVSIIVMQRRVISIND
ncbi:hypothetical protein [Catenovulum agarivorans]|uniref:hypothetical protein n=1 Tax=Catenovulum agarivorans TaxID=1172192 RepID=UPI000370C551|nr:hypothetical protein [Catenovulum agarivorans]